MKKNTKHHNLTMLTDRKTYLGCECTCCCGLLPVTEMTYRLGNTEQVKPNDSLFTHSHPFFPQLT